MHRDPKHDYKSRCIYHITIGKDPECPAFSQIRGTLEDVVVVKSGIGKIIEGQILNFPNLCKALQVLQYVIMPDHVHFAVFAREVLQYPIGRYVGMLKVKCGQQIRAQFPGVKNIFTSGFHDRYLRPTHSLPVIIEYIRQNPYRLMVRRMNPDFFRRVNNIVIQDSHWQAYGNLQLLDNPFKAPVVIHRADSESVKSNKIRRWKHLAGNGGVLVSPFISPEEKGIRRLCEEINGKVILLCNEPFKEREKPSAHDFDLCAQGKLLILAPMSALPSGRESFLYLNSIAETIAIPKAKNK